VSGKNIKLVIYVMESMMAHMQHLRKLIMDQFGMVQKRQFWGNRT
jgi:hypothetical protein